MDKKTNQYVALEYIDTSKASLKPLEQLKEYIKGNTVLGLPYSSTSLAYATHYSTLVPESIFKKEDIGHYTNTNFSDSDLIFDHQVIANAGVVSLYGFTQNVKAIATEFFPSAKVFHHSGILINVITQSAKTENEQSVTVNLHDDSFDIVVSEGKKLLLLNSYRYKTKEDYLYFLLKACEQLQINMEKAPVTLYGRIETSSQLTELSRKYIQHVHFGKRPTQFTYGTVLTDLPQHYFYNLFSQFLCV